VHAASVRSFRPSYHSVSGSGLSTEALTTTNDCFTSGGSFSEDTEPMLVVDPASTKPGIACPRGNTANGYRWSTATSSWAGTSLFSSTTFNSSVSSVTQSNGVAAFTRYYGFSIPQRYLDVLKVDATGWNLWNIGQPSAYSGVSGVSVLRSAPARERVAYRSQFIVNFSLTDAGSVMVGTANDAGVFTFSQEPWVVAEQFAQEPDGTVLAFLRDLTVRRLVAGAWSAPTSFATPSGTVNSMDVLVDPQGVVRVAWGDSSGVWLASRFGGTWIVERVATTPGFGVKVAVNASGKVAVAGVISGALVTVWE
jgi:hypothetical protein